MEVWFWDDILHELKKYEHLVKVYYKEYIDLLKQYAFDQNELLAVQNNPKLIVSPLQSNIIADIEKKGSLIYAEQPYMQFEIFNSGKHAINDIQMIFIYPQFVDIITRKEFLSPPNDHDGFHSTPTLDRRKHGIDGWFSSSRFCFVPRMAARTHG